MPTDDILLLGILLLIALLVGWWTGRQSGQPRRPRSGQFGPEYFEGLNFLLNEQPDKALEVFIRMVEVDSDTIETHLALGSLFRRRGETERAIRIHQNLIARPNLSRQHRTQALFELGEDYMKAGLLDRAENLFTELTREKPHTEDALRNLLIIYEQQKDWDKAVNIARHLESVTGRYLNKQIAHYYCEIAERELSEGDLQGAGRILKRASAFERDNVRVQMLNARLAEKEGRWRQAVRHYRRAFSADPEQAGSLLKDFYGLLSRQGRLELFEDFVGEVSLENPKSLNALAMEALRHPELRSPALQDSVDRMLGAGEGWRELNAALNELSERRSGGLRLTNREVLGIVLNKLRGTSSRYHCIQCGYTGKQLFWQCPSCREWETLKPEFVFTLSLENAPGPR